MNAAVLHFDGIVHYGVFSDDRADTSGFTSRVGGEDVIAAVSEAARGMREPVTAAATISNDAPIVGTLTVTRGHVFTCCGEGCDEYEAEAFKVGDTDVLKALAAYHDDDLTLNVTLIPAMAAVERMVVVEFAHHVTYQDKKFRPLDVIELPVSEAQRLTTEGGITRQSAEAAGLTVAPLPPEHAALVGS